VKYVLRLEVVVPVLEIRYIPVVGPASVAEPSTAVTVKTGKTPVIVKSALLVSV
jgi:hypothetical protein